MLGLVLVTFVSLIPFALQYQGLTSLIFAPPKGSRSYNGQLFVNSTFPNLTHTEQFAIMVDDVSGEYSSDVDSLFCEQNFSEQLELFAEDITNSIRQLLGSDLVSTSNYYTAKHQYPLAKSQFCTKTSMLMQFCFNGDWDWKHQIPQIRKLADETFKKHLPTLSNVHVDALSMTSLLQDVAQGTMRDILVLDGISVICGFIIVTGFIRKLQLQLISLVNLVISLTICFGFSCFLAQVQQVPCFAAAIQSAITVALTFINSLFLFDSVKKDIQKGSDAKKTLENMLQSLGHIVIVSGCCLGLVFLLMVICPVPMIKNIGITGCISVVVVQIISTINTTALIAMFPKFFLGESYNFWAIDYLNFSKKQPDLDKIDNSQSPIQEQEKNLNSFQKFFTVQRNKQLAPTKLQLKIRTSLSWMISKKSIALMSVGAVVLITCIFAYPACTLQKSIDLSQMVPKDSRTMKGILRFGSIFGFGLLQPFTVVFHKDGDNSLVNSQAFKLMGQMASQYIEQSKTRFTGNDSYMQLTNKQVMAPFYVLFPLSMFEFKMLNKTSSFQFLLNQTAPFPNNLSTFAMQIQANIPITGKGSDRFAIFFREIFDEYKPKFKELGIEIGEYSIQTPMTDAIDMLFDNIPLVIGIILGVLVSILAVAYKSILVPVRFLFKIAIITLFYLGINVLIYQYGHFHDDDALFWASIFLILSISIGLGCVHEIFAFQGIYVAYWKDFKSNPNRTFKDCVYAASDNLMVVMTAGLIMIVSFSGLLFSSIEALFQFGTCLMIDLVFDTLFVVPILVPALTYLIGESTMFPGNWLARKKMNKNDEIKSIATQETDLTAEA